MSSARAIEACGVEKEKEEGKEEKVGWKLPLWGRIRVADVTGWYRFEQPGETQWLRYVPVCICEAAWIQWCDRYTCPWLP